MATISLTLPADGDTIDASDVNNPFNTIATVINGGLDNANIATGANIAGSKIDYSSISNPYKFRVRCTTAQTTPNATFAKVQFNSEDFDTNGNYDPTTNYRYTIPISGFYQINSCVIVSGNPGTFFILTLYKNGSALQRGSQINSSGASGVTYSDIQQFTAGDYIEIFMFTSSVTTLDITNQSYFSGYLVSTT